MKPQKYKYTIIAELENGETETINLYSDTFVENIEDMFAGGPVNISNGVLSIVDSKGKTVRKGIVKSLHFETTENTKKRKNRSAAPRKPPEVEVFTA